MFPPGSNRELGFSWGPTTPNEILSVVLSIRRRSDFCNKIGTGRASSALQQASPFTEILQTRQQLLTSQ